MMLALALLAAPAHAGTACTGVPRCMASDLPLTLADGSNVTIAVHTYRPNPAGIGPGDCGERYIGDGAPVAIFQEGGFTRGSLDDQMGAATDMVKVTFLLPGGFDNGYASGGTFDDRGVDSIAAMAEVIAFASGNAADDDGDLITDLFTGTPPGCAAPLVIDTTNVGVVGSSNGGNLPIVAAATESAITNGLLDWIVTWETPISSQINVGDLGGEAGICNLGTPAFNPYYTAWGAQVIAVDYSALHWDASGDAMNLYHDGDGDGDFEDGDAVCEDPDTDGDPDGDGFPYEDGEDFPVRYYEAQDGTWYYSRPVSDFITVNPLVFFGGPPPAHIATRLENRTFWDLREGVRHISAAAAGNTDLEVILLSHETDHMQATPYKDHIRQAAVAWKTTSSFFRINPSRAALEQAWLDIRGSAWAGDPLPNMGGRALPASWSALDTYTVPDWDHDADAATPDEPFPAGVTYAAAAWELADREQAGL